MYGVCLACMGCVKIEAVHLNYRYVFGLDGVCCIGVCVFELDVVFWDWTVCSNWRECI